jgi:hypothetical protein
MFPPTICATPNSAIARLKLAIPARTMLLVASLSTVVEACESEAPSVLACFIISGSMASIAVVARLTTIGVTSTASPMIMPDGVNSNPKKPNGPALDNNRNKIKPKPTVGIPSNVLKMFFTRNRPRKLFKLNVIAIGSPHRVATNVAVPDTYSERKVISMTLGSPEKMSCKALINPSNISFKGHSFAGMCSA